MKTKFTLTTIFILVVLTALTWQTNIANGQFVTKGLVSYWSFDNITGTTVKDGIGKNDGTITGNPGIVAGKLGKCLKFSSTKGDDFVLVKDDPSLDVMVDKDYSVELWFNPVEVRQQMILLKGSDAFGIGYALVMNRFNTPNINLVKCGVADQNKEYKFDANNWYHIVAVQTAPQVEYFVNGKSVGVFTNAAAYTKATGSFKIGGGNTFGDIADLNGLIDELRVYDRALSKDEVGQNFAVEVTAVDPAGKSALTWGEIKVSR